MAACSTTRRNSSERSASISRCGACRLFAAARPDGLARVVCRKLAPGRPIGPVAEEIVCLHDLVDFARAFVNHRALAIPEEPADRILVGVAVCAVDLHGITGCALR